MFILLSGGWVLGQTGIVVLGIAQDGGYPQIGCENECKTAWDDPSKERFVVSMAIVDEEAGKWWLVEATPDLPDQLEYFRVQTDGKFPYLPEGVFLTHAHMGHYTGLLHFGREVLGADRIPVYVLPRFADFLRENGPWDQLVALENIVINELRPEHELSLSDDVSIKTHVVPHRDEYSETAGFSIRTGEIRSLFIPDIDKWSKWDKSIIKEVSAVDRAFLDGSFFENGELPNRDMSQIPHPFVAETMDLFKQEVDSIRSKVYFIHFNHTNPLLWDQTTLLKVLDGGFNVATQGKLYR